MTDHEEIFIHGLDLTHPIVCQHLSALNQESGRSRTYRRLPEQLVFGGPLGDDAVVAGRDEGLLLVTDGQTPQLPAVAEHHLAGEASDRCYRWKAVTVE